MALSTDRRLRSSFLSGRTSAPPFPPLAGPIPLGPAADNTLHHSSEGGSFSIRNASVLDRHLPTPRAVAAGAGWMNADQQGELSERSEFSPCRHSSVRRREPAVALAMAGKTAGESRRLIQTFRREKVWPQSGRGSPGFCLGETRDASRISPPPPSPQGPHPLAGAGLSSAASSPSAETGGLAVVSSLHSEGLPV